MNDDLKLGKHEQELERGVAAEFRRAIRMRRQLVEQGVRRSQISFELRLMVTPWEKNRLAARAEGIVRRRTPVDGIRRDPRDRKSKTERGKKPNAHAR